MNDNNNPLVTELTARAGGASAADAAAAARAGSSGWGDLPGRTAIAVAASVLAVAAIAAASWGLSRHDGKESATPNAPESSDITFGPNQPDATPTVLPTLPDASTPGYPSNDVFSTPSYSTASAPSSYTTTGYPYSTSTTPYSPYTSTSSPTTTPRPSSSISPPAPTQVRPVAPTATPIRGRCGTYGSLRIAQTNGIRYSLTLGNGREGRWEVEAHARRGYAIVSGATTRWDGNLGRFKKCPATIRQVTAAPTGDPDNPWQVTVRLVVPETEKRTVSVAYWFDTDVTVNSPGGAGWACTGPEGVDLEDGPVVGSRFTCAFGRPGTQPPAVFLKVSADSPSGIVSLSAGGQANIDSEPFGQPRVSARTKPG